MRLWRLTRTGHTALDGAGTAQHGGRYSPPGVPVVNFASEAGLAVLVALRYLSGDPANAPDDYVLGWTEIDAVPERIDDTDGDDAIRGRVTAWLEEERSLLAAVRSQVLPEADVVLMNPLHPDAARVQPLVARPFSFEQCLHTPPMLARYSADSVAMEEAHTGRLFDHVGIHVRDVEASRAFYAAVLEPLGLRLTATADGGFSVDELFVNGHGTPTGGLHLAFQADSPEVVDRFHAAALAAGAIDNGAPGERAYHPGYYAAYALDPDGNNVEAVYHGPVERSAPSVVFRW